MILTDGHGNRGSCISDRVLPADFTVGQEGLGEYLTEAGVGEVETERILDSTTGSIQNEIDSLTDRNETSADRIDQMLTRLEIQRKNLLDRFIVMETALATMERIMDSMRQTFAALSSNDR